MSDVAYTPSAADVKALRDSTQAGMMDCKRAGRGTGEGLIESYVHDGKIGAMVEVGSETDFVARNDTFRAFVRKVAMQIAAGEHLRVVSEDDLTEEFRASELEIFRAKAAAEGKPEAMLDKIADGMWKKSLIDYVLLNQPSIRPEDDGKTIETLRAELSGTLGENIQIKRFARFQVGVE